MAGRPGPLTRPLVAQGGSWDLFVHAKDLFVAANGATTAMPLAANQSAASDFNQIN